MQIILNQDKETKGSYRWNDNRGHNIYLTKEEAVANFGGTLPKTIVMTLDPQPVIVPVDAAPAVVA